MLTKETFDWSSFVKGLEISNSKVLGTLWKELEIEPKTLNKVFDSGLEGEEVVADVIHTSAENYVNKEFPFVDQFIKDELVKIIQKGHMSLMETYVDE